MIVALLGLAQRFAIRPSPALTYLTEAVFPYYILHQTLIVFVGFWFTMYGLPVAVEVRLVAARARLRRRLRGHPAGAVLRPLFGLSMRRKRVPKSTPLLEYVAR